jgi:hypothetical protein
MTRLVYKKLKWKDRQPFKYACPKTATELVELLEDQKPKAFKQDEFISSMVRSKENPTPVKITFIGEKSFSLQVLKVKTVPKLSIVTPQKEVSIDLSEFREIEILVK